MEKFTNKVFEILSKPAKWIFVGGAFAYALWFAIRTAMSIDGQFMNVLTNIITLFVGTALCVLPPLFILIKKEELAKLFFVFLLLFFAVLSDATKSATISEQSARMLSYSLSVMTDLL